LNFNIASRSYRIKDSYKTRTSSITFSNLKVNKDYDNIKERYYYTNEDYPIPCIYRLAHDYRRTLYRFIKNSKNLIGKIRKRVL